MQKLQVKNLMILIFLVLSGCATMGQRLRAAAQGGANAVSQNQVTTCNGTYGGGYYSQQCY